MGGSGPELVRTAVLWCLDWPVVATGVGPDEPAAVFVANRVVSVTPAARDRGIEVGQRRREAQGRCPQVRVLDRDDGREARTFEAVVRAVEAYTPRIELTRPGVCAFATRGPSRYYGGDEAMAAGVAAAAGAVVAGLGWADHVQVGVADSPFAATLAARLSGAGGRAGGRGRTPAAVIPAGATPTFLAPLPVTVLREAEVDQADALVEVLLRLGLRTLGAFASVPAADVAGRFGPAGSWAHALAGGRDPRPPAATDPAPELTVATELDPPAERVDHAAFVAKRLADELGERLEARALSCTRVAVMVRTERGEHLERLWRHEGALSPGAVADRVRWQLDGWLNGPQASRPTGGVDFLQLAPDEVVPATGRQLGFWGEQTEAAERAARALARVQGLLGPDAPPDAVAVPEWRGGRSPDERVRLVPAAAVDLTESRTAARPEGVSAPWPGRLPSPAPTLLHAHRGGAGLAARVVDASGATVRVDGRGEASAPPARVAVGDGPAQEVRAWAGPWPADERWWDASAHRRRARFQMVLAGGTAHLLTVEAGQWWVEATYD